MKPTDEMRICDRCKVKVAKHVCISCEEDICKECAKLFVLELQTQNMVPVSTVSAISPYSLTANNKKLGSLKYSICKKCEGALKKEDTLEVVKESEEMKKFLEKVKKTILASRMASNLDESEVDEPEPRLVGDFDFRPNYKPPKGFFSWMKGKKKDYSDPFL